MRKYAQDYLTALNSPPPQTGAEFIKAISQFLTPHQVELIEALLQTPDPAQAGAAGAAGPMAGPAGPAAPAAPMGGPAAPAAPAPAQAAPAAPKPAMGMGPKPSP